MEYIQYKCIIAFYTKQYKHYSSLWKLKHKYLHVHNYTYI